MTDALPTEQVEQPAAENPVEVLRDEFKKEFDTLKAAFEAELKKISTENEALKAQNTDLQRALIRSATVTQAPEEKPKTEEELYRERVASLAEKALRMM